MALPLEILSGTSDTFFTDGYLLLDKDESPISKSELEELNYLVSNGVENWVEIRPGHKLGNHHCFGVFLVYPDDQGFPVARFPISSKVVNIINSPVMQNLYQALLETQERIFCRRVQVNRLKEGDRIGAHNDMYADSDLMLSVILHLDGHYEGGEFILRSMLTKELITLKPKPGSLLILNPRADHCVETVTKGDRKTLVAFVSTYDGPMRPFPKKPLKQRVIGKLKRVYASMAKKAK